MTDETLSRKFWVKILIKEKNNGINSSATNKSRDYGTFFYQIIYILCVSLLFILIKYCFYHWIMQIYKNKILLQLLTRLNWHEIDKLTNFYDRNGLNIF